MALIPATPGDFRRREYWDAVFAAKQSKPVEWYGNYDDFAEIFEECLRRASDVPLPNNEGKVNGAENNHPEFTVNTTRDNTRRESATTPRVADNEEEINEQNPLEQAKATTDNAPVNNASCSGYNRVSYNPQKRVGPQILHVGCGNSELSERLTANGYGTIVNVDFSPVVIERMKRKHRHEANLVWECLDVRGGSLVRRFGEEAFDAVVDKGFFDALVSRDTKEEQRRHRRTATEPESMAKTPTESIKRMENDVERLEGGVHQPCGGGRAAAAAARVSAIAPEEEGRYKDHKKSIKSNIEQLDHKNEAKEYLLSALKVRGFYAANVDVKIHPLPLTVSRRMSANVGLKDQSLLPFVFCVEKKPIPMVRTPEMMPSSCGAQREEDDIKEGKEKETATSVTTPTRCVMKPELGRAACDDVFVIWELPKKIQAVIKWRLMQLALCMPNPGSRSVVSIHSCGIQSIDASADEFPRYVVTIYDVVDHPRASKKEKAYITPTAAILTAPGEERCWLFATSEGNEELAKQAGAKRILIVTRGSDATANGGEALIEGNYEPPAQPDADVQHVSNELGPYLADLALPNSGEIPLMMVRNASTRVIAEVARERSQHAGWITVRDLEVSDDEDADTISRHSTTHGSSGGGTCKRKESSSAVKSKRRSRDSRKASSKQKSKAKALRRQMLFYCNPHTVQSELKLTKPSQGPDGREGDGACDSTTSFAFLQPVCGYHIPIAAAFALLREARESNSHPSREGEDNTPPQRISAALLGLGGGVLSMFLHSLYGDALDMELTCVDNDPVVVDIAYKYFGFRDIPGRLHCVVGDAREYVVDRLEPKSTHVIIVDINSGLSEVAMRCPPEEFVDNKMLMKMKEALAPGGLLIFNLLCRCLKTKNEVIERLSGIFPSVSSIPVSEDANEIVVCQVDGPLVELPARRGVVDRHLRKLVYALEGYASTCERDGADITKCAGQLLNCGKEWRVQACRDATGSSSGFY